MALLVALLATCLLTPPASADVLRLGGVRVDLPAGSTQVVTVNHTHGHDARVTLWSLGPGGWTRELTTKAGRTGYGGLVAGARRHQGSGTTPLGTYGMISAFGTHATQPGWLLPYRTIARGDFWVEDNGSAYYNRYRNQAEGGFRWRLSAGRVNGSERLTDYPRQYEYAIVTSYNQEQVRHRGAGIFLHVNGRGATAGCVSAPRWFLQATMARLDPTRQPVIAIGR
ncbi:MAG: secreted protein [Nocardioidaceae bacterium]|nr:secreted protein [Nocardioidaceae bacterium]